MPNDSGLQKNQKTICQPIYRFSDEDIWEYVERFRVKMNPLYAKGYKRVGCVGCPMGGGKRQLEEFKDYPTYKTNYIKAFDRMVIKNNEKGIVNRLGLKTGEEWFRWWVGENPKQVRIEDILNEGDDQ